MIHGPSVLPQVTPFRVHSHIGYEDLYVTCPYCGRTHHHARDTWTTPGDVTQARCQKNGPNLYYQFTPPTNWKYPPRRRARRKRGSRSATTRTSAPVASFTVQDVDMAMVHLIEQGETPEQIIQILKQLQDMTGAEIIAAADKGEEHA